jgi:16S rRNA (adenine1518-N6/adenine1519-N6)-dimethyltransferase
MHVRAKKHLGQHFLRDLEVARRIALSIQKHQGCCDVLEVGPGTGALTVPLLERGDLRVKAVELDDESVAYLTAQNILRDEDIVGVDLLKWNPSEAFPGDMPFIVAGNFPYNISSQILFRVLEWRDRVPECVGMFQKEVAERVAEGPGSKAYGILSVLLQTYYDIDYLFTVEETAFNPPPKVKSGVIRLLRNDVTTLPDNMEHAHFVRVVKAAFNQRRKTLRNSIKGGGMDPDRIPEAYQGLRAEQLSVAQFHELALALRG